MLEKEEIREYIDLTSQKYKIKEGVEYNKEDKTFSMDFFHDGENDIISLKEIGYSIESFGRCYYYGYEFNSNIDSKTRSEFLKFLKYPETFANENDLNLFIKRGVENLDKYINLADFKLVVYPQSMSEVNRKMISYLNRFTNGNIA